MRTQEGIQNAIKIIQRDIESLEGREGLTKDPPIVKAIHDRLVTQRGKRFALNWALEDPDEDADPIETRGLEAGLWDLD